MKHLFNRVQRRIIVVIAVLMLGCSTYAQDTSAKKKDHFKYWDLGAGNYGVVSEEGGDSWAGRTPLDIARWDWAFGNCGQIPAKQMAELINKYHKINPKLKLMIQLWPFLDGRPGFLDYLYKPGVKEGMFKKLDQNIETLMNIDHPEKIYGLICGEEILFHFASHEFDKTDPDKLPGTMAKYRDKYEKETGKKLEKWDVDARTWCAKKFVVALNELNAYIKKKSGGKRVFVYLPIHYRTLDWVEKGEDLNGWRILPVYFKEMIKPGVADGFFAYNNNELWSKRYMDMARKHNWPFFTQLTHEGGLRLESWKKCVSLAKTKMPQNLGYFFYTHGGGGEMDWNADPSVEPGAVGRQYILRNMRRFCAQEKVGMDVLARELKPRLQIRHKLGSAKKGDICRIDFLIENIRDASWYLNPADGDLKNVRIKVDLPKGLEQDESINIPIDITIDNMKSGEFKKGIWWLRKTDDTPFGKEPVTITVTADNALPVVWKSTKPEEDIKPQNTKDISESGESWRYFAYDVHKVGTPMVVTLECKYYCATRPRVCVPGNGGLIWNGTLHRGEKLVMGPGLKAVLYKKGDTKGVDVSDKLSGIPFKMHAERQYKVVYKDDDESYGGGKKIRATIEPFVEESGQ